MYSGTLYSGHKGRDYRGVLISGVNLYYKAQFGKFVSLLNTGVSLFQGVLDRGVSLYTYIIHFLNNNKMLRSTITITIITKH